MIDLAGYKTTLEQFIKSGSCNPQNFMPVFIQTGGWSEKKFWESWEELLNNSYNNNFEKPEFLGESYQKYPNN